MTDESQQEEEKFTEKEKRRGAELEEKEPNIGHVDEDQQVDKVETDNPSKQLSNDKRPSAKLQEKIRACASAFRSLNDIVDEVIEDGKSEGFTHKEIGNLIREEMLRSGLSRRTVTRYLPSELKAKPRGITASSKQIRDKMSQNPKPKPSQQIQEKSKKRQKKIIENLAPYKKDARTARARLEYELKRDDDEDVDVPIKEPGQGVRDEGHLDNKLECVLNAGTAIDKLISLMIGTTLPHNIDGFKNETIDSNKDNILAFIKSMGDRRMLLVFDERLNVLSHLIRVTQQIIDQVTADYERQENILKP
jgi:hypothetical protein